MARTALNVQTVTSTGMTPVPVAANVDGHSIPHAPGVILVVDNGSGAAVDITVPTTLAVDGLVLPSRVVNIPAGQERHIAVGGQAVYRQADGSAWINYPPAVPATVTAYAIKG